MLPKAACFKLLCTQSDAIEHFSIQLAACTEHTLVRIACMQRTVYVPLLQALTEALYSSKITPAHI